MQEAGACTFSAERTSAKVLWQMEEKQDSQNCYNFRI